MKLKWLDRIAMLMVAAFFAWCLILFIGDAIEANKPAAEQAVAHSASELSDYYTEWRD